MKNVVIKNKNCNCQVVAPDAVGWAVLRAGAVGGCGEGKGCWIAAVQGEFARPLRKFQCLTLRQQRSGGAERREVCAQSAKKQVLVVRWEGHARVQADTSLEQ